MPHSDPRRVAALPPSKAMDQGQPDPDTRRSGARKPDPAPLAATIWHCRCGTANLAHHSFCARCGNPKGGAA